MDEIKRLNAKKVRIADVVNGKFFPGSKEEMKAGYVITRFGQKVSRVNLIGSVVDKFMSEDGNFCSVTIDDGTESIRVKAFKEDVEILKNAEPGKIILVTGKLKSYNNEVYVNAEIAREVEQNYESLRRLEILKELVVQKKIVSEIRNLIEQASEEEAAEYAKNKFGIDEESLKVIKENLNITKEVDYKPKILELISSLDQGNGVEIGKILELSNLPESVIEGGINELLGSGMLYEPRAGILKKV
jgi:RPA family protein